MLLFFRTYIFFYVVFVLVFQVCFGVSFIFQNFQKAEFETLKTACFGRAVAVTSPSTPPRKGAAPPQPSPAAQSASSSSVDVTGCAHVLAVRHDEAQARWPELRERRLAHRQCVRRQESVLLQTITDVSSVSRASLSACSSHCADRFSSSFVVLNSLRITNRTLCFTAYASISNPPIQRVSGFESSSLKVFSQNLPRGF